ncbi:E3 ubiquitin-protein ligase RNF14-like [Panonychus citri]|uniref:E3 ubiquitin-protein ligase RNF14-like n=1 Tax=Panonychus citri TaxID=50023 RepID=UPI0023071669|nr:E3 ubiquitin-protein ligase RNF14-like [Panonychus citri]
MSDYDAQKDEILAIKSIFESDNLFVHEDCRRGVFIASPVLPEPPLIITYSLKRKDNGSLDSFSIDYLPPFEFQFELPDSYPSKDPPRFLLSCEWLSGQDLRKVCARLDKLWDETQSEILYQWFDFLLHDLINFLEIRSPYNITTKVLAPIVNNYRGGEKNDPDGSKTYSRNTNGTTSTEDSKQKPINGHSSSKSNSSLHLPGKCQWRRLHNSPGTKYYDRRGRFIRLGPGLIERMKRYDSTKRKERFENSKIECGICFSSFFGIDTVAFGCDHYYCANCIKTYLETLIANGQVHSLVCPFDKCNNTVDPEMVKVLVGPDLYQKYDSILLSSAIGNLGGIIYCPRINCLKPIITEHDPDIEKLVHCPYCDFAFCTSCKMTYHGVDPCKSFADEDEKIFILREYDEAAPEKKKLMEKEYGEKFLFQQLLDFKNKNWLKDNSKQCPSCAYSIQKIDGCNKIHCFRCNCNFCWLCLAKLRSDNPYLHFRDKKSPCFAKLFEGVIQDEDTDDDDDEWEEMNEDFLFQD